MKAKLNNRGFSLIELAIGIAIVAVLIFAVSAGSGIRGNASIQSAAKSVNTLRIAAENYIAAGNLTYAGIDIAALQASDFLPAGFRATGSNSFGGDYAVAANTTPTLVDVSLTSVDATSAGRLDALFANSANSISYDGGTETWTVTF